MRIYSKTAVKALVLAIALASGGVNGAFAQGAAQSGWDFDLAVYGWLPTIEGKIAYEIPGIGDSIEVDPRTLLDNLQFTAMVAFAANHDSWSILGDVIYLKEAANRNRPLDIGGGVNLSADLNLDAWIASLGGAYEVTQSGRSTLGVLVGVRYFSTDSRLSLSGDGPLPADPSLEASAALWNGIVGVRGRLGLAERWFVPYHLDIGTGDSDVTWQAIAGVGYDFTWGSLLLTYRYLDFDQGDNGDVLGFSMAGGEFGVVIRF